MRNPLKRLFATVNQISRTLNALPATIDRSHDFRHYEVNDISYDIKTHSTPIGRSVSVTFKNVPRGLQWAIMVMVRKKLANNVRYGKFEYLPASAKYRVEQAMYVAPFR